MEYSQPAKYPNLNFIEASIASHDEIPQIHCSCIHCVNNTRPLVRPRAPRIVSKKEKKLNDSQAYRLILKQLAQNGFSGHVEAPDVYLIESSHLVYSNKSGKMRIKQGQTNLQVKRHFDQQRRKGQAYLNSLGQATGIIGKMTLGENIPGLSAFSTKAAREIALMTYKDNTEQIVNEALLSKIFQKRKNDPFWEEISHILQIPPQMKQPIQKYKYHYERTGDTLMQLAPIMEKLSREIDNIEEKSLITQSAKLQSRAGNYRDDEEELEFNPELKLSKPTSQKLSRVNSKVQPSPKAKKYLSMQESIAQSILNFSFDEMLQQLKIASLEIVSFLQVTSHYRILNIMFEYFIDQKGRLFVCNTKDVVWEQLENNQLTIIHDRYHPLEEVKMEQLIVAKQLYDNEQEEELWKICTAVVNECLEIRKIELNLTDYKKPSNQTLLKIFLKIFPDFKSENIFKNVNWKNDLSSLIADLNKKINKIIRQDEGIRILRRFNIQFRRTFR